MAAEDHFDRGSQRLRTHLTVMMAAEAIFTVKIFSSQNFTPVT